jgi:sec-independent protein translocase protein TatB
VLGVGAGEFIALAVIAIIVVGPEKLPRYAAEAGRILRNLRRMADTARAEVSKELGPEFSDLSIQDLNPRTMVRRHLLDPIDLDSLDGPGERTTRGPTPGQARGRPANGQQPDGTPPPYDAEAT